ncbi:cortex morphogenetic protein CmpA [Paenibacillus sp. An7]|nr:cortex morphogenetic protein CmpA [Paenibacillus sp. An7]
MPQWLSNQLMRAFHKKDRRQIRLLNECWFFYRNRPGAQYGMTNETDL